MTDPAATAVFATTSFNVLGPVTVEHDGIAAAVGGPRQVAVLARLLIGVGHVVTMDQLVDAVWDGDSPTRPEVTVRSYLSNLRRVIEPDRIRGGRHSCIESCSPGYRLNVDRSAVDAIRFEDELERGRTALIAGDLDGSTRLLDGALARWQGGPYEGVLETVAVSGARSRLDELRLAAVECRAELRLARGEHEAVMPLLDADLVEHPLRERLTELAMLALYRAGRQSEALEVCGRLRTRLVDRLGISPGPDIQRLEHQILNHDEALRPPTPAAIVTGGRSAEPAGDVAPAIIDLSTVPLVERPEERAARHGLLSALQAGRGQTVAVTGEPGSGKSVLASSLAAAAAAALRPSPNDREAGPGLLVITARSRSVAAGEDLWLWSQVLDRLPPSGRTRRRDDPMAATIRMQDVVDRLRLTTEHRPVLIVIEDGHWADVPSIETLLHATEELGDRPLAVIVTWRSTDRARPDVLQALRRLARIPSLIRIELGGLDVEAVDHLVAARRGPGSDLAASLHRATAGNPAYLAELLIGLGTESGDERLITEAAPTTNLRELIRERVGQAHDAAVEVLSLAAVVEGPFSAELLAAAGDFPPGLVDHVLELAVDGGLLTAAGPHRLDYRFTHPVAALVLCDDISGPRRARLHGRLGHTMWRRNDPPAAIARHFAQAASANTAVLAARFALEATRDRTGRRTDDGDRADGQGWAGDGDRADDGDGAEMAAIIEDALDAFHSVPNTGELEVEAYRFLAARAQEQGQTERHGFWSALADERESPTGLQPFFNQSPAP